MTRPDLLAPVNWAGNVAYHPRTRVAPATLDELAEIVASADRVKALGSRHSFNTIADTEGVQVSVAALPRQVEIDGDAGVVRAAAGLRYGELADELERQGWALRNLASLPHISLAGAIATGTHGSGDRVGSLASAVTALQLVTSDGDVRWVRRGDADFDGAVISLGALGVVVTVELEIVPSFAVSQTVYRGLALDRVIEDLDAVTTRAYSTSMFTTWRDPDVIDQVWLKRVSADGDAPDEVLGARRAAEPMHPLPGVSAAACTDQSGAPGPWLARLPHFRMEFTPSNGDELQSEYLVPRRHAAAALGALRAMAGELAPLVQICELRTVAADGLWLSSSHGTDVLGLHFTWVPDQPAVTALLPALERALAPSEARPHWGKLFDTADGSARMAALYPRWPDFLALRERLDPRGVFRNAFLDRLLDG